jgi:CheY-like chemotaxis protein
MSSVNGAKTVVRALYCRRSTAADVPEAGDAAMALGSALGKRTAARGGAISMIAVTAYDSPQVKRRVLAAGFQAQVARPLSPSNLAAVVRNSVSSD